jgi:hypothetical protein
MIVAETARPEKFPSVVEPIVGKLPLPPAWGDLLTRDERFRVVGTDPNEVMEYITKHIAPA